MWSDILQCDWDMWAESHEHTLELLVPRNCQPDKDGVCRMAELLSPHVLRVEVNNYDRYIAIYERPTVESAWGDGAF